MKYRHREYTVPAAEANQEPDLRKKRIAIEQAVAAIRRRLPIIPEGIGYPLTLLERVAEEIFPFPPQAREPKVHVFEAVKLEAMGLQPFESVAPLTIETHYDPDTFGDDGEGGITGDGLGDIGNP